jgi:hypothetical protein
MARARKGGGKRTIRDLQDEAAAAEAQEKEAAEDEDEDEEAEEEAESDAEEGDGDDEDSPKPKKKKAAPKPKKPAAKKPAAKRVRTPKEVRTRAVWVVFDNGSKRVKEFPYPQKPDAERFLAEKQEEKKGTFYINLVKDEIKDKE